MAYFTESSYGKYIELQNVSGSGDPATAPVGGAYLFSSGTSADPAASRLYMQNQGGVVTDLAKSLDIDAFDALGGAGLHQTQDHFVFSDNGTEKKITFSNLQDAVFADVSGDATIAAGGALTIAAQAVENSMLADDAVGADELAANAVVNASIASNAAIDMDKLDGGSLASSLSDLAQGDLMYAGDVDDSNNLKSITFSNLEDAIFGNVSGDATIAAGGALTIAAQAVENSMLADDAVGADELAANAVVEASIVDNAVTLAKMAGITRGSIILGDSSGDPSLLAKGTAAQFLQSDGTDPSYVSISGDATVAAGGALTIGTGVVEHAMLAADCVDGDNIQDDVVNSEHIALGALDAEHFSSGSIQTGHVADNQVTLAKMAGLASAKFILGNSDGDPAAVTMSGDATMSNTGALTIAAAAVEHGMLAEDIISGQAALGGATVAQADLLMLDDGPGAVKKVTFSNFEDSIFGNVSGDLAVAAGGAATIQADAVEGSMLNDNVISGQTELAHADIASADELMISDGGTLKKVGLDSLRDHYYGQVSGDATIADGGALTIAAQAVENSMLADDAVGADELAANAVVNASVASNAAIALNKIDGNVDMGGDFVLGNQADDTCLITGLLKLGAGTLVDSGNNAAISLDGSAGFSTLGGYGGGTGITFSAAAGAQLASNLTVNKSNGSTAFDATFFGDTAGAYFMWDGGEDRVKIHNGSAQVLEMGNTTAGYAIDVATGTANVNKIRAAAFVTYSDESLKSDVASMSNTALDTVMSLEGVEFTWKDSGERDFGFIAQDVQSVLPKAVHVAEDGVQGVDYSRLTSVLVEAVKAQQVQIEELKAILKK